MAGPSRVRRCEGSSTRIDQVGRLRVGTARYPVNVVAPMGSSDAFGAWYNELSQEQKERYLEGVPLRRIGDPEIDIGSVVAFLISRGAGFITGRTIFVDGGRSYYDR